jgi:hypothetical protein
MRQADDPGKPPLPFQALAVKYFTDALQGGIDGLSGLQRPTRLRLYFTSAF